MCLAENLLILGVPSGAGERFKGSGRGFESGREAVVPASALIIRGVGAASAADCHAALRLPGEALLKRRIFVVVGAASACAPSRAGSVQADGC